MEQMDSPEIENKSFFPSSVLFLFNFLFSLYSSELLIFCALFPFLFCSFNLYSFICYNFHNQHTEYVDRFHRQCCLAFASNQYETMKESKANVRDTHEISEEGKLTRQEELKLSGKG